MSTFFTKIYILVILSIIPSKPKIYVQLQEKEHFFCISSIISDRIDTIYVRLLSLLLL
ncbi:hypothetical protein Hanom_Chr06g00512231 [Helianthus anomalus]